MNNKKDTFYYINDLKLLAKTNDHVPYIYSEKQNKWIVDRKHYVYDRLFGYDEDSIGSSSKMAKIKEISIEKVNIIIDSY